MSTSINTPTFTRVYALAKPIAFNPLWVSKIWSDFYNAVEGDHAPKLEFGQVVGTVDDHGRKIILVGIDDDVNIIVYEITSNKKEVNGLVCLMQSGWEHYFSKCGINLEASCISEEGLEKVFKWIAASMNPLGGTNNAERIHVLDPWAVA